MNEDTCELNILLPSENNTDRRVSPSFEFGHGPAGSHPRMSDHQIGDQSPLLSTAIGNTNGAGGGLSSLQQSHSRSTNSLPDVITRDFIPSPINNNIVASHAVSVNVSSTGGHIVTPYHSNRPSYHNTPATLADGGAASMLHPEQHVIPSSPGPTGVLLASSSIPSGSFGVDASPFSPFNPHHQHYQHHQQLHHKIDSVHSNNTVIPHHSTITANGSPYTPPIRTSHTVRTSTLSLASIHSQQTGNPQSNNQITTTHKQSSELPSSQSQTTLIGLGHLDEGHDHYFPKAKTPNPNTQQHHFQAHMQTQTQQMPSPGLNQAFHHPMEPGHINVREGLAGSGTLRDPWRLTNSHLNDCCRRLSWTCRSVFFPAGIYGCCEPLKVDFGLLFPDADGREMLREGVAFRGVARASVIIFLPKFRGANQPLFQVFWKFSPNPQHPDLSEQVPLFFWEFTGLNFKGNTDNELVRFGGSNIEETPWNSCVFKLCVNNGYTGTSTPSKHSRRSSDNEQNTHEESCRARSNPDVIMQPQTELTEYSITGPARGINFMRVLESFIDIVATCAQGIAAVFDHCEFSTIKGSFSNAECDIAPVPVKPSDTTVDNHQEPGDVMNPDGTLPTATITMTSGRGIRPLSRGAYFLDCCAIVGLSINLECAYIGITLRGASRGLSFTNIISNNCDHRGAVFDLTESNDHAINSIACLIRRQCIQGAGLVQDTCAFPHQCHSVQHGGPPSAYGGIYQHAAPSAQQYNHPNAPLDTTPLQSPSQHAPHLYHHQHTYGGLGHHSTSIFVGGSGSVGRGVEGPLSQGIDSSVLMQTPPHPDWSELKIDTSIK